MKNKKIIIFIICIIIVLLGVVSIVLLNKNDGKSNTNDEVIKSSGIVRSEMGTLKDLDDRIDYQNGNFKLVFNVNSENDQINILYNEETIITTDYNHAAKVRVNLYGNLYIIEIHYPMAQCPTLSLFFIDSNGNPIEQSEIENSVSRIEYFEDVNKIIIYKEECMPCDGCNKKYTYELKGYSFKLISEESDYKEELTKVENDSDYSYYSFNFNKVLRDLNDSYEFNINNYKLKYVLTKFDNNIKYYDFYINDKKIYSGLLDLDNIKIKVLGKYIIFTNTFSTDVRSTTLYIYDGITLKEIYELDEIKGMVIESPKKIVINKDGILISGTRLNNGPTIVYDDKLYDTYSKDTCSSTLKELKDDFIVKQDYFYKYTDSTLNFVPEKSNRYLLKNYVKNEEFCKNAIK